MFGRECHSVFFRISSMVGPGSLLMNTPWAFSCSFKSWKYASSTFGLLGGDLGEEEGVFFDVDETDIIADERGDTLADDRVEDSLCASLSILM